LYDAAVEREDDPVVPVAVELLDGLVLAIACVNEKWLSLARFALVLPVVPVVAPLAAVARSRQPVIVTLSADDEVERCWDDVLGFCELGVCVLVVCAATVSVNAQAMAAQLPDHIRIFIFIPPPGLFGRPRR
jgi:hypothetical protein